jgi:hypothetical protein
MLSKLAAFAIGAQATERIIFEDDFNFLNFTTW